MTRILEIRTITLKSGTRDEFHRLAQTESRPIQARFGIDVVRAEPPLHSPDAYVVVRSFASAAERERIEEAFYASDDWRKGPRESMLARIDTYVDAVFEVSDTAVEMLREPGASRVVELRTYTLKAGTRDEYHRLFEYEAGPMLARWKIDVVRAGPSLHDENVYFLMRAFDSVADRDRRENEFYASDEWRKGPREAVIACIESYSETVFGASEAAIDLMRFV